MAAENASINDYKQYGVGIYDVNLMFQERLECQLL